MRVCLPAVATLIVASLPAHAHVADEVVVRLDELPDAGFVETVTMTAETLSMLAPVDADGNGELTRAELDARPDALRAGVWEQAKLQPCVRSGETASLEPGYVALTARFACGPGELSQEFRWLMVLPSNYRVRMGATEARADSRTVHVPRSQRWQTRPLLSVTAPPWVWLAIAVTLAFAAWRSRRARLPALGAALFLLGFWLVHRLMS